MMADCAAARRGGAGLAKAAQRKGSSEMAKPETRVARADTTINDLRFLLEKYKDQIAVALPKHITAERMMRVALTAFGRNPLLAKCSATSICGALVQASILGLEPDGMSGECFLIPYWSTKVGGYECSMQAGYKGLVKLARNSGEISMIDAQPIHENDEFSFQKGSETFWFHRWDPRKDRGPIYGYWAGYKLKDGGANFEYMSVAEIEDHRDRYSQGAYRKERGQFVLENGAKVLQGPWKDSPDWMFRKTPLVQVLKLAPKSIELRTAMTLQNSVDAGMGQAFVDLPKELSAAPVEDEPEQLSPPADAKQSPPADKPQPEATVLISAVQVRRLEEIAEENGWRQRDLLAWLKGKYMVATVADIRAGDYDHIIGLLKTGGDEPPPEAA
jgi:recombination protein RecT